jgi:hypothetical protein
MTAPQPSVVDFYKGRPLANGLRLVEIWDWPLAQLEADAQYIEWMFPLVDEDTARAFVWDDVLRDRVHVSLATMLRFFGLERLAFPNGRLLVLRAANFPERRAHWVLKDSHSHNRLARILASLRQLGHENEARALFRCLEDVYREEGRDIISPEVFYSWREAAGR